MHSISLFSFLYIHVIFLPSSTGIALPSGDVVGLKSRSLTSPAPTAVSAFADIAHTVLPSASSRAVVPTPSSSSVAVPPTSSSLGSISPAEAAEYLAEEKEYIDVADQAFELPSIDDVYKTDADLAAFYMRPIAELSRIGLSAYIEGKVSSNRGPL